MSQENKATLSLHIFASKLSIRTKAMNNFLQMPPVPVNTVRLLTCCVLALGHKKVSCKCCPVEKFPSTSRLCQSARVGYSKQPFLLCGKEPLPVPTLWLVLADKDKQTISYKESIM